MICMQVLRLRRSVGLGVCQRRDLGMGKGTLGMQCLLDGGHEQAQIL